MSNLNQRILERSIRHHFQLQRYSSKLVADMLGLLNSVDDDLEAKIRSRLETSPAGTATTRRLQQLLDEIRELNAAAVAKVSAALPGRLERFAVVEDQIQRDLVEQPLGDVLGYHFRLHKVSADTLRGIVKSRPWDGRLLAEHFKNLGASRSAKVISRITAGLAQGSTTEQIIRSIMGRRVKGGTRAAPLYEGGVLNDSRKNVTSLVRTYASIVANDTRDALFAGNTDVISGQMWVSTLDDNTTPFCQARDGQLYDLDHNPLGGAGLSWEAGPGRSHWQCRSTSVPVLKALDDLPIDWSKVGRGKGQRAAVNRDEMGNFVNGQAPESSDYTSWLRSQPRRIQEDVLGKSRAKWFAENERASVGEAWAQNFKLRKDDHLTLQQLAAKAGEDPATGINTYALRLAAEDKDVLGRTAASFTAVNPTAFDTLGRFQLPDGSFTPERQALHDAIVRRHFQNATPVGDPVVTVLGGGPASGKSTAIGQLSLPKNLVHIDTDEIRAMLPEYREGLGVIKEIAAITHEESDVINKRIARLAIEGRYNVLMDGTGNGSLENLTKKVNGYRAGGGRVVGGYVTVDTDEAMTRMVKRGDRTGRYVPEEYLRGVHRGISEILPTAMERGLFDEVSLWDNNGATPILVATARGKAITIYDRAAWDRFLKKANAN